MLGKFTNLPIYQSFTTQVIKYQDINKIVNQ